MPSRSPSPSRAKSHSRSPSPSSRRARVKPEGAIVAAPSVKIDRETACPMLMKLFCRTGAPFRIHDLQPGQEKIEEEFHMYTWRDATLREISSLVKDVYPDARKPTAKIVFHEVITDRKSASNLDGRLKELGFTFASKASHDENKTLAELQYGAGNVVCVSVLMYQRDGGRRGGDPKRRR